MRLDGEVAVLAGAASGMGRAMALGYAREGASVVMAQEIEAVRGPKRLGRTALGEGRRCA